MSGEADWLRERLEELERIERPSASEGERRAAEWLVAQLAELGAAARIEAEAANGTFWWSLGLGAALGALGAALTPGRSLAVDRTFMPLGPPVWLSLEAAPTPDGTLRRLVVAQDTGGAIRGPVRGDLFGGAGPEAERRAGMMKARGAYYLLLPRDVAARLPADGLPRMSGAPSSVMVSKLLTVAR